MSDYQLISDSYEQCLSTYVIIEGGICRLTFDEKVPCCVWLSDLLVDSSKREKGIATNLFTIVFDYIKRDKEITKISLQVNKDSWMHGWYVKLGFEDVCAGEGNSIIMCKSIQKEDEK